jgi:hypothetical protein
MDRGSLGCGVTHRQHQGAPLLVVDPAGHRQAQVGSFNEQAGEFQALAHISVRHEALLLRMEVRNLRRLAVVVVG